MADIIDRVTDLGQDELSIVLRVIAERSQIGAKVCNDSARTGRCVLCV